MVQQVIFSERAYVALMTETMSKINTETGGIFLGRFAGDKWYVIESIDPGPRSIFSPSYFEYDESYVNHLVNKVNLLYKIPLRVIGLWHRHPGSMDSFSSTDNGTHEKFVGLNSYGVISALVNIDPTFRISVYFISRLMGQMVIQRKKLPYLAGNEHIPADFISYKSAEALEKQINDAVLRSIERRNKSRMFDYIISKACEANQDVIEQKTRSVTPIPVPDDDLEKIIEAFEKDFDFFEEQGINCNMSKTKDGALWLRPDNRPDKENRGIEIFIHNEKIYIRYNQKIFPYAPGFFTDIGRQIKR